MAASEKLQKYLAERGYGSRRQLEQWIVAGRVEVNGEPAHLGQRVTARDRVAVDGRSVGRGSTAAQRVLLLNKRAGVICTRRDPEGRPTVFDDLPKLRRGRWISVGRLDIQTTGLLLLTTDGELADRMMRPATGLDREYAVRVNGRLAASDEQKLRSGVRIDGELLQFSDVQYYNGRGVNHWYHVVLMEGRNREVRRLFDSVGLIVSRLKRVRFGPVVLPSTLARGAVMEMGPADVHALYALLKLPCAVDPSAKQAAKGKPAGQPGSRPGRSAKSVLLPYPELPG